jgi:hypothetical protein
MLSATRRAPAVSTRQGSYGIAFQANEDRKAKLPSYSIVQRLG